MATGRLIRWASCGAAAVWLLAGCGGSVAQAPKSTAAPVAVAAPASKSAEITDVRISGAGDEVLITVLTSARAAYSLVRQANPPRLHLRLEGAVLAGQERVFPVHRGVVTEVKSTSSGNGASVDVFLSADALYEVEGQGTSVVLHVTPKAPAPVVTTEPARQEQPAPVAEAAPPEPAVAPAEVRREWPAGPRFLTAIDVRNLSDGLVVTLQGNGPLNHEYFLVEGKSLVVDIAGAGNKVKPMKKKIGDSWVSQVRIGEHEQPKKVRVVFDLKQVGEHRVDSVEDRIVVSFGAPALAAAAPVEPGGAMVALNTVSGVSCRPFEGVTRLEIRTAVKTDYMVVDSGDPAKIIVEIANARIAERDARTIDLSSQNLDVVKVTSFPYAKGDAMFVRVVAQLRRPVPFRSVAEGKRIVVDFEKSAQQATTAQPASAAPVPVPVPIAVNTSAPAPSPSPSPVDPPPAAVAPATSGFTGRRLSLDFKDAEVNDILRLISEVSGLNFVAGPEVKGTVSIKLADVPWDQALDLILKTNEPQLAQIRESDTIVRITTADKIIAEQDRLSKIEVSKKATADAQQALEPLFTKVIPLSYTDNMAALPEKLKGFASKQGKIDIDERTKSLIVHDTVGAIANIEEVLKTLDAPTPAVLVEARIVQMDSNAGQNLGVEWGLNFIKDPAHGNATKYAFPNSVAVAGTQGASNYMVNLPASGATSGVGLSFGHIANTLGLDLKLSAMESMGKTKILSTPKILVLHTKTATMQVGVDLPVVSTTTTPTGTTQSVEWKKIGIVLTVTPSVTNDKHVVMKISVSNDSKGDNVQTTGGDTFSINKKNAETEVIVADGETTVIGGLYEETTSESSSGVPGLNKIPIIGWIFKNRSTSLKRTELMIFLTPRIVVM